MPTADYSFLSDQQRAFLESPDEFDSQRSAELSYRIRQKYSAVKDDLELLRTTVAEWDKTTLTRSAEIECRFSHAEAGPDSFECENTVHADPFIIVGEAMDQTIRLEPDGWIQIPEHTSQEMHGVCPECRDRAREYASRYGTVPCAKRGHSSHKPHSKPFAKCKTNLALLPEDVNGIDGVDGVPTDGRDGW